MCAPRHTVLHEWKQGVDKQCLPVLMRAVFIASPKRHPQIKGGQLRLVCSSLSKEPKGISGAGTNFHPEDTRYKLYIQFWSKCETQTAADRQNRYEHQEGRSGLELLGVHVWEGRCLGSHVWSRWMKAAPDRFMAVQGVKWYLPLVCCIGSWLRSHNKRQLTRGRCTRSFSMFYTSRRIYKEV